MGLFTEKYLKNMTRIRKDVWNLFSENNGLKFPIVFAVNLVKLMPRELKIIEEAKDNPAEYQHSYLWK